MVRIAVLLAVATGLVCGCAPLNTRYAAQYCEGPLQVACSPVTGDGSCQPCT
jgi:hypothetical protein